MCLHIHSKFYSKSEQKLLTFSNKASFERGLFRKRDSFGVIDPKESKLASLLVLSFLFDVALTILV